MKMTECELKSVVLGRIDNLNTCILEDKTNNYVFVRGCLSEALTIAMQLGLIEPVKADGIGAKADAHLELILER